MFRPCGPIIYMYFITRKQGRIVHRSGIENEEKKILNSIINYFIFNSTRVKTELQRKKHIKKQRRHKKLFTSFNFFFNLKYFIS